MPSRTTALSIAREKAPFRQSSPPILVHSSLSQWDGGEWEKLQKENSPLHQPHAPRPQPREESHPFRRVPPRQLRRHAAELLKGVVDPWRGEEAGSWEGLDGDVEAVKLERAEGAAVETVCVEGFLAEGGVDEWWHFLEGGIGWCEYGLVVRSVNR